MTAKVSRPDRAGRSGAGNRERALGAWWRYGKGRHRAALNFGDCFSYALAERTGFPLLCTGGDFAATDLDVVPSRVGSRLGTTSAPVDD